MMVASADTGGAATQAGTVVATENVSVDLRPADTANGDRYASLDENDELRVDLTELNRDSQTTAHQVFAIDVTGDEYVAATVTSDTGDVSFYWDADPTDVATENVTIAPDGQVTVGVAVHSGTTVESSNFTVTVSETDPPKDDRDENGSDDGDSVRDGREDEDAGGSALELSDTDVRFPVVHAGDTADLEIPIRNADDRTVTETVGLEVDGERVAEQTVTVPGRGTRTVRFEYRFPEPGTYEISIDGRAAGSITVDPPRLRVSNAALSSTVVERGESVAIVADVTNHGEYADGFVAELSVGGAVVDRTTVHVEPGATERVTFEQSFDRRGGYEIAVSGESAGTLQVESALGASVRRHGSEHGPVLGVLSIPVLAGAAALSRGHVVLFWR